MIKRVRQALVCMFIMISLNAAFAYGEEFDQDFQNWDMVTLTAPLSPNKKVLGYLEFQPRVGSLQDDPEVTTTLIRPAIGYQVNKHLSLWQGYGWTPTYQPDFRNEHRIFQQGILTHEIKKLKLTNRTRLEERFIENAGGTAVRARHQLRLSYPLGKSRKWSLVAYDELFVNLNTVDRGPRGGFDQNRVFAGLNRTLGKRANMEAGYLNNYLRRHQAPDRMNHVLLLTLNLTFN